MRIKTQSQVFLWLGFLEPLLKQTLTVDFYLRVKFQAVLFLNTLRLVAACTPVT
ncbi:hypothetical protein GALL_478890 [mine drainage metagenome]|uniref:Uncharacterized protein n=1 Tax=mine drainage metagenome TaxID=410659 RepID=A0A1J5PYZ7_9ZZZZ